jgi:hypothetical protein
MTLEEAGLSSDHNVIDITGYAYFEDAHVEGDRWIFTGKAKYSLLTEKEGEYASFEMEMPYRYTVESKNSDGDSAYANASAEVISARVRLDGERIGVDSEIMMKCIISNKESAQMLDSVSFGEESEKRRGEYVIFYPSRDDSLWSVAKKYCTTVDNLLSINKLASTSAPDAKETLAQVKYLVI